MNKHYTKKQLKENYLMKLRDKVDFEVQPESFNSVDVEIDRSFLKMNYLKKYKAEELLEKPNKILSKFKKNIRNTVFILVYKNKEFLVNTEGYKHAKYVAKIV